MLKRVFLTFSLVMTMSLAGASSVQAQSEAGFQNYLPELRAQAQAAGVSQATLNAVFSNLTYKDRVIELDRDQPGGPRNTAIPPFAPYKARHVNATLIRRGRDAYQRNRWRLKNIERDTGVPESIMVAIWGHETNYGAVMGGFDLPDALATLAYEGRRRALFSSEFVAALKMMDRGISRSQLEGSWAGATGGPQFLPSVYLRLARDGDGDGKANIWTSDADTLASIANYFVNAGWRAGEPWGIAVRVPAGLDRDAIRNHTTPTRCPRVHERMSEWKTMAEWRALGVTPESGRWPNGHILATLLEPDGPNATAYLLTGNYRVILDYNCSNFYALSVGLLADEVER